MFYVMVFVYEFNDLLFYLLRVTLSIVEACWAMTTQPVISVRLSVVEA